MFDRAMRRRLLRVFAAASILPAGCTTSNVTQVVVQQQQVVARPGAPALPSREIPLPPGEIAACSMESTLNAIAAKQRVSMTVLNQTGGEITLFWLDYHGDRKAYGTIRDGHTREQDTFVTHPWVLADATGKCLEIVLPGRTTQTVVLKPPYPAQPPSRG
jgi:hypothetical protein